MRRVFIARKCGAINPDDIYPGSVAPSKIHEVLLRVVSADGTY